MGINISKKSIFFLGVLGGVIAIILAISGNPKNMAICAACFIRDMAGAMKLHNAAVVQYFRPEIVGIVLGAFTISMYSKEYKVSSSSSISLLLTRFVGGIVMMIGALVFLGCTTRMTLRMAAGDLSAYVGLIGLILGVGTGFFFLKKGYKLPKKVERQKELGYIFPIVLTVLLVLSVVIPFASSQKGPGSMHAPLIISLLGGIVFGIISQKTRMCFTGSFRNMIFMKNFEMIIPILGMFLTVLAYNLITGQFKLAPYGPIAHNQTLWNILGLYVVGLAGTLLGGCPVRQIVLASQGSLDSVITVLGMFVGAAISHNFKIAAAATAKATEKTKAVVGGPGINGQIAIIICIIILLIIGFLNIKKEEKKDV